MRNPAALAPLRHPAFRLLWTANLASNTGLFIQNTAAGWMMTGLDPSPMMVSTVQASSMLPVFLLALPAGALADIMDRRVFLIGAQLWMALVAALLCVLTWTGALGPWGLVALTFGLGAGLAMTFPAWAATTPELVPREDLISAIALNGIGFNLTRAVGPAIGGLVIAWFGIEAAFALNAACVMVMVVALFLWKRPVVSSRMPPEHFLSAVRAGARFVAATPAMHAAILRAVVFFLFGSAVWGLLPLLVRTTLQLGPQAFGLLLGCMGAGAVAAGFLLPAVRGRLDRSGMVFWSSLLSALALVILATLHHWSAAAVGMMLYGVSWISAASTLQASAQMAAPSWVRARAMGIYQMCFFGAMAAGAAFSGWMASVAGVEMALGLFAFGGATGAVAVRGWRLEGDAAAPSAIVEIVRPEPAAAELRALLNESVNRVLEVVRYEIAPADRAGFLACMTECRRVRLRGGAATWRLYEDVAHPQRWVELWAIESWAEHLREDARLTEEDRVILARAAAFHQDTGGPEATRYVNVRV
ncbi:MAG: transporter [Rubritepida sp.]|nr:transporter [Rubritepida sp.]